MSAPSDEIVIPDYDLYRSSGSPELYAMLREFGIGAGSRVLDVGIGTGLASAPLAEAGAAISGIDPSPAMVARARARLPRAEIVQAAVEQLPFADGTFDAAIAADVLHLTDQAAALAELARVVRKGGRIAIWWPALSSDSEILGHRAAATRELQAEPVPEPLGKGFRAFYGAPLAERTLRVVPAQIDTTVAGWVGYERTRAEVHQSLGARANAWFEALEAQLVRAHGDPGAPLRVRLIQYLYVGTV